MKTLLALAGFIALGTAVDLLVLFAWSILK